MHSLHGIASIPCVSCRMAATEGGVLNYMARNSQLGYSHLIISYHIMIINHTYSTTQYICSVGICTVICTVSEIEHEILSLANRTARRALVSGVCGVVPCRHL